MEIYFDIGNASHVKILTPNQVKSLWEEATAVSFNYFLLGELQGEGSIRIEKKPNRFKTGDIVVLEKGDIIEWRNITKGKNPSDGRLLLIDMDGYLQEEYKCEYPDKKSVKQMLSHASTLIRCEKQENLAGIVKRLIREAEEGRLYYEAGVSAWIQLMIIELFRCEKAQRERLHGDHTEEMILPVLSYIDGNYRENLTVEDMARVCGVSESHFRRAFLEYVGEVPMGYVNRYRIDRAKELLMREDLTLEDVRMRTGYQTTTALYRNFKKYAGTTPGEYRLSRMKKPLDIDIS